MRNKYELVQRLWPIQYVSGRHFVQRPFTVEFITRERNLVMYSFTHEYGFPEYDCFPSEAEAQTECERRNVPKPPIRPQINIKDYSTWRAPALGGSERKNG